MMTGERLQMIIEWLDWDRLTKWEEKFVEDIENRFKIYGKLTERQEEVLEEIFKKKQR